MLWWAQVVEVVRNYAKMTKHQFNKSSTTRGRKKEKKKDVMRKGRKGNEK
jgi:hypothetical protein